MLGVLILELHRAEIAECGMQTFINVHVVDDAGKVGSGIFERLVGRQVDGLDLQSS